MDLRLNGRTALVTGASAGIGRGIAKRLALEGASVVILARREAKLQAVANEISEAGGAKPTCIVADLAEPSAIADVMRTLQSRQLTIEILVNNAGGSAPVTFDTPDSVWDYRMTLNYSRQRELAHALLPGMRARRWGRIINITGIGEPMVLNATLPAKAAMHSWAKGVSREVAKEGITVNCIAPGRIVSEQALAHYTPQMMADFSEREIPINRFGEVDELAVAAAFLASPLASYITGVVLPVDGGLSRHHL